MAEYYPFLDNHLLPDSISTVPLATEYAYDMTAAQFKYKDGKMYIVEKIEALKIKLWKLFMTEKFRWVVFPWSYGHELETLIGRAYTQGYINSEAERFVKEAVSRSMGHWIYNLRDMKIHFEDGKLYIEFQAETIYGNMNYSEYFTF